MRRMTARYSLVMACYWSNAAVLGSCASVYLLGHGFSNTRIGLLLAVAALLSAVAQPLIGAYADAPRSPSVKAILLALVALFLACVSLLPLFAERSTLVLAAAYTLALTVMQCMSPLNNALGTIPSESGETVNFGAARGVGSLVFAVVSLGIGSVVAARGIALIPLIAMGLYALYAVSLALFPFRKANAAAVRVRGRGFLRQYPGFAVVLAGASALFVCHGLLNSFAFQIVVSKGGDSRSLGVAYAIAALMELPLMFGFTRLLRRVSAGRWLIVSGFAYVAKGVATLVSASVGGFYAAQTLQILSYAVLAVASVYFIRDTMRPEDAVKGQTFFTMTGTVGSVLASALGGWLLDALGVPALVAVAVGFALIGALVTACGVRRTERGAASDARAIAPR